VYYAEAQLKEEPAKTILKQQYQIMTHRLWYIITWPAAILTTVFGVWMLLYNHYLIKEPWMHIKLVFILLLWVYQLKCHQFVKQILSDRLTKTSSYFRIWNEGATLLLFSVVFVVVLKSTFNWIFGVVGLLLLAILLMLGIKWYKTIRDKK
jgi:putative membrane protein